MLFFFLFFKQKTAYEMRISDWSSDVCSSDLFCECKIALTFLRTPDFAFGGVPCTQAKFAYLIGRYINIIRASKIIGFRTAQKTKAVGQDLNGAKADRKSVV